MLSDTAFLVVILLGAFNSPFTDGSSVGQNIGDCDVYSDAYGCDPQNWGLDFYGDINRLNCTNAQVDGLLMYWASKPVRSLDYEIFAEVDGLRVDSYFPEAIVDIVISTKAADAPFRGIMLYATNGSAGDENKQRLGNWIVTGGMPPVFQHSDMCQKTVLHYYGVDKGSRVSIRFQAPAKGSGVIHFECLLKIGGPNKGAFFWPNLVDFSLSESAAASTPAPTTVPGKADGVLWIRSTTGQSCTEACGEQHLTNCIEALISAVDSKEKYQELSSFDIFCSAYLSTCSPVAPALSEFDSCYFNNISLCMSMGVMEVPEVTCNSRSSSVYNGNRLCPCSDGVRPESPANSSTSESPSSDSSIVCPSASLLSLLMILSFSPFWTTPARSWTLMAMLGFLVFLTVLPESEGHNWMESPSRNSLLASTILPNPPRKVTDIHIQVGPGQNFQTEWVAGHSGFAYWVMVHGSNITKIKDLKEEQILEYLQEDPNSGVYANDPAWTRYHYKNDNGLQNDHFNPAANPGFYNNSDFFAGYLQPGDPFYIFRPPLFPNYRGFQQGSGLPEIPYRYNQTHYQMKYKVSMTSFDMRSHHASLKYPYIEQAARFMLNPNQAARNDVTNWTMSVRSGFGHYVLRWMWSTYRDAVDIDYVPVPVDDIWGKVRNTTLFSRYDHAQYLYPSSIQKNCRVVTDFNVANCLYDCGTANGCTGVNIIPFKLPSSVPSYLQGNLYRFPWNNLSEANWTGLCEASWFPPENYDREDFFLCFTVSSRRDASDEVPAITVTDDTRSPVFYSTVYQKRYNRVFPVINDPEDDRPEVKFMFDDGACITCEDYQTAKLKGTTFVNWKIAPSCQDCDVFAPPARELKRAPTNLLLLVSNASLVISSSATCNQSRCLLPLKWPGNALPSDPMNKEDCYWLAKFNPNCSRYVHVTNASPSEILPRYPCACFSNEPCCGSPGLSGSNSLSVFEVDPPPTSDPGCLNGKKMNNQSYNPFATDPSAPIACCSSSCNVCEPWPNPPSNHNQSGFCRWIQTRATQSCDDHEAPCIVNRAASTATVTATVSKSLYTFSKETTSSIPSISSTVLQDRNLDVNLSESQASQTRIYVGVGIGVVLVIGVGALLVVAVALRRRRKNINRTIGNSNSSRQSYGHRMSRVQSGQHSRTSRAYVHSRKSQAFSPP